MNTGHLELARAQQDRWQSAYAANPRLHGTEPSQAALWAAGLFAVAGTDDVLELGCGQGRDALYFAAQGVSVHATDFCELALDQVRHAAQRDGLDALVTASLHDVRDPLPPANATIGAVFANELLCMALTREELRSLVAEIHRVLRPGGLFAYTVWATEDPNSAYGVDHGDGLYEQHGYVVRYFDRALIDELAEGWELGAAHLCEDGGRRLWRVAQAKPS
jgi:SAM-dependent methyltransferase